MYVQLMFLIKLKINTKAYMYANVKTVFLKWDIFFFLFLSHPNSIYVLVLC